MSIGGRERKRATGLYGQPYVRPMPRCTATSSGIHRDGRKCLTCGHHHCGRCGICARCRAKALTHVACYHAGQPEPGQKGPS